MLANLAVSLILRARLSDAPTFAERVRRCHRLALGAAANQDVPLQTIIRAMHEVACTTWTKPSACTSRWNRAATVCALPTWAMSSPNRWSGRPGTTWAGSS